MGPNFADIGTFVVPLSTYVIMKTGIKWVPFISSYKDAVRRLDYILKNNIAKTLLVPQNASKLGFLFNNVPRVYM